MKNCIKCGFENKDTAIYCVKCGASLVKKCDKCGELLDDDDIFCPKCGSRVDGKVFCPNCNKEVEKEDEYCNYCGAKLTKETKLNNIFEIDKIKNDVKKVIKIVKSSVLLAISLLAVIFSLFGARYFNSDNAYYFEIDFYDDIKYTPIDLVEGAFSTINPKEFDAVIEDFDNYADRHLTDSEYERIMVGDDLTQRDQKKLNKLIEKYNLFKLCFSKEAVDNSPSSVFKIWFAASIAIINFAMAVTVFVFACLNFAHIFYNNDKYDNTLGKLYKYQLLSILIFGTLLKLFYEGKPSFLLVFSYVIIGIAYAIYLVNNIIKNRSDIKKANVLKYLSHGLNIVICIVVLNLATSSLVKVDCSYVGEEDVVTSSFEESYNAFDIIQTWDNYEMYKDDDEVLGQGDEYLENSFNDNYYYLPFYFASPMFMGLLGTYKFETPIMLFSIFIELSLILLIVFTAYYFVNSLNIFNINNKKSLRKSIDLVSSAIFALILIIVYICMINTTTSDFNVADYSCKVSGVYITLVVFVVINLLQRIFLYKNYQKDN